ncbi:hypothetical protein ACFW6V_28450 [Streptomyces sp. NPDC058734]|uniref:hypothetical protein n=1 Tax=Streptomyces sp. NPDC058734 TaxID=3346615 RepID=UPI003678A44C
MTTPHPAEGARPVVQNPFVLPKTATGHTPLCGPRFWDPVWDLGPFIPRSYQVATRIDFGKLPDPVDSLTAREYLYSRFNRPLQTHTRRGSQPKPLKVTAATQEFWRYRSVLDDLRATGALRLAEVTQHHLDRALADWHTRMSTGTVAIRASLLLHIAAHTPYLSRDGLRILPWGGRSAAQVAGHEIAEENTTPRIPEEIMGPLLAGAVFYVRHVAGDMAAARAEVDRLEQARAGRTHYGGGARARVEAFIAARRAAGRGLPGQPPCGRPLPDPADRARMVPNEQLIALMAGVSTTNHASMKRLLLDAGAELGYEDGGLDTPCSTWPGTGRPWRTGLNPTLLSQETHHVRVACWIVIAYLSGMRDTEVRALTRDCATTTITPTGRTRHKITGRVFKHRKLTGDKAEWIVLDVVHEAVDVLREINNDPDLLFGYTPPRGQTPQLLSSLPRNLRRFRDHLNDLFSTPDTPFIPLVPGRTEPADAGKATGGGGPGSGGVPWMFDTRQFRRTLAWYIAHRPFGVVAGSLQYKHARLAVFEGYAGTSASGFAAELHTEEALARLDLLEDLYRGWNRGSRSGGVAAGRVNAEFERIRRDLGDLPGLVADTARLRVMLEHLAKILHPGVLSDCFFQPATALCVTHRPTRTGNTPAVPAPATNQCLRCPNARRTTRHRGPLQLALDQARSLLPAPRGGRTGALPALQQAAIDAYTGLLAHALDELTESEDAS